MSLTLLQKKALDHIFRTVVYSNAIKTLAGNILASLAQLVKT
jgi:hypothetical protein